MHLSDGFQQTYHREPTTELIDFLMRRICHAESMRAERVGVSRKEQSNRRLIRIQVGEEVIRRHCNEARDVDAATLRHLAVQMTADEGLSVDPSDVIDR
jgi:hypothetical protein